MVHSTKELINENVKITLRDDANFVELGMRIVGRDLSDKFNEPTFFSQSKRNIDKAWEILVEKFTPATTMYQAMEILSQNKIKTHSYCAVD